MMINAVGFKRLIIGIIRRGMPFSSLFVLFVVQTPYTIFDYGF